MKRVIRVVPIIVALVFFMNGVSFVFGMKARDSSLTKTPEKVTQEAIITPLPNTEVKTSSPVDESKQSVQKFYTWYLNCKIHFYQNPSGNSPKDDCPYDSSEYFSHQLTQQLDNSTLASGFDPILCTQSLPSSFNVTPSNADPESPTYILTESFISGQKEILVSLKNIENTWKIVSIDC